MRIAVRVRPGSARLGVGGEHDGALVVRVSARAVDGQATAAALAAVAAAFGVRRRAVTLVAGASSRTKIVEVAGADPAVLDRLLGRWQPGTGTACATMRAPSELPLCRRAGVIGPATSALAGTAGVPQPHAEDGLPGPFLAGHPPSASASTARSRICRATVLDVAQAKCQAQVRRQTPHVPIRATPGRG
jgi:uncharacterized protein YggU (UPF0235/DUF167 family)